MKDAQNILLFYPALKSPPHNLT